MTVGVHGPAWALKGLGVGAGRYPLAVEGPVMRAVDRLVPGVSTVTRYVRYHSLYAAIAAHAEREGLDVTGCRRLVRRCEVLLAALQCDRDAADTPWAAHGVDRVRRFCAQEVEVARAADENDPGNSYSPRRWGFWNQYGGPATVLGLVEVREGALRPGRHRCPPAVRELLAPLTSLAQRDTVSHPALEEARQAALGRSSPAEEEWLTSVLTATRSGVHVPADWETTDHTRRATLRVLARAIDLNGGDRDGYQETLRSAVAFGDQLTADPVLASIPEAVGWRGLLLRHYSVNAWRRLWAALVAEVGSQDGEADRSAEELRDWLARQAPGGTLRRALNGLPALRDAAGHPLPAERQLLHQGGDAPMTSVLLLLVGALRSRTGHLADDVRAVFLGRQRSRGEFLDPTWVDGLVGEYCDRPVRDFAARLVDDMLAQSRRVALAKLRTDPATGLLRVFSRLHVRNERYFKTGDEGDSDIGTRIPQLGSFGRQLGLFADREGRLTVTPAGRSALDITR